MARDRALALLTALLLGAAGLARAQPALQVVPAPRASEVLTGAGPALGRGVPILAPAGDAGALAAARDLSRLMKRTLGLDLPVRSAPRQGLDGAGAAIAFERAPGPAGEAYDLSIGHGRAVIAARDDAGLFYGAQTLWQLAAAAPGPRRQLPAARITDAPRFAWRGLMLDSARHFQSPAEIEKIIDAMARLKLNVLQWHLTDDQGWRLDIRKYPRLTQVGAWRTPEPGSPDGRKPYGGFYTQAQVRRIVAYAAARHVTIVPEIEMPGHALSALLAYPRFGAGPAPDRADQVKWGGFPYVYDVDDRTLGFLEDVLTEVMSLFPGRYIHVGGDEAQRERWYAAPAAQARLKALGATDPAALQAWFTGRIAAFLAAHGRRLVGWDEILQGGGLPPSAVVTSWHGVAGGLAAAAQGHDAVLAPSPIYYFDNRQGAAPGEPPGRGFIVDLKSLYDFEPMPPGAPPAQAAHILGVEGAVWTEHVRTARDLEAMAFPRLAALAETAWSAPSGKSWPGFFARLPAELARERALGLRPDLAAVTVTASPGPGDRVSLGDASALGEVRYTLDGSVPGPASRLYAGPIASPVPATLKAVLVAGGRALGPVLTRRIGPLGLSDRMSQDLELCNNKLSLDLEGAPGRAPRTYLVNPQDPCWIFTGADLDRTAGLAVTFQRLPFNFAFDPGHDLAMVRPPRRAGGELEVREDNCLSEPVAVEPLPPGGPGTLATLTARLPRLSGRHDLCITFTGRSYDPLPAIGEVRLLPRAATAPKVAPEVAPHMAPAVR